MGIDFLTLNDVLHIHSNSIELYGGAEGIRDLNLLESAIAQPTMEIDNQFLHEFPFVMAAAYMFHITSNHPFVDGNKRTGAMAALAFLDLNGFEINAPKGAIYDITIEVATGNADKKKIASFFKSNI
jgi:death-on-curing protein